MCSPHGAGRKNVTVGAKTAAWNPGTSGCGQHPTTSATAGEEASGPAHPTNRLVRQFDELIDHEPAEGVLLQGGAGNGLVHDPQVGDGERIRQQVPWVRRCSVFPP